MVPDTKYWKIPGNLSFRLYMSVPIEFNKLEWKTCKSIPFYSILYVMSRTFINV
jgi:hypothetical protein